MKSFIKILCMLLIILMTLSGCSTKGGTPVKGSQFLLDTIIEITLYEKKSRSNTLLDRLFKDIESYEHKFSRHLEDSEISEVNNNSGAAVPVSLDTLDMVQKSLLFSRASGGLFDISIGPLVDLWDIASDNPRVPAQHDIDKALDKVDYRKIIFDPKKQTLSIQDHGMSIDVGAIAKGYITDKLVETLREEGITSALLNLGGNLYLVGSKTDGSAWKIGIRDPYGLQGEYIGLLSARNISVVTSGIYERYFEENGTRYHHIINPKTGWPEQNNIASVAILSTSSATADGLSTTVFLLGLEEGMAFIEETEDTEAIIVTKDKRVYLSSGIQNGTYFFEITNLEYTIDEHR